MSHGQNRSTTADESTVPAGNGAPIVPIRVDRASPDQLWWVVPTVRLFDAEFGAGYVDEAELHHLAASPESAVFLAHRDESILAGVSIVSTADRAMRERFGQSFVSLGFTGAAADGPAVGCLRSVVVLPAARGYGIGNGLVDECVRYGRHNRWSALYAASWVSRTSHQSAGILARNGFATVGTIADYWLQDTSAGMSCVVCGARCRCAAVIMRCQLGLR